MFIDPISHLKMKAARAKGGMFWYCPHSRGRMINLSMARHYLGSDETREIWVRANHQGKQSNHLCPSCRSNMTIALEPKWLGGHETDVCLTCQIIWIGPDEHSNKVPHPEDLLVPAGDSTLVKDRANAIAKHVIEKEKQSLNEEDLVSEPKLNFKNLVALVGLPYEESKNKINSSLLVSYSTMGLCLLFFLLSLFIGLDPLVNIFGYIPDEPFNNLGWPIIFSTLIHSGSIHLIFNLYFYWMFSDDIEDQIGHKRFLIFSILSAGFIAGFTSIFSQSPQIPHIGLSGIVCACISFYALSFPKHRIVYLLPSLGVISTGSGAFNRAPGMSFVRTMFFNVRVPVWFFFILFALKELAYYILFERNSLTFISYSGHIGGLLSGIILWFAFVGPKKKKDLQVVQPKDHIMETMTK